MKTATPSDVKLGTFSIPVTDDNGLSYLLGVKYDYHYYYSPFGREVMVTGYDYSYEGVLDKDILDYVVEEAIKENEFNPVYFNI